MSAGTPAWHDGCSNFAAPISMYKFFKSLMVGIGAFVGANTATAVPTEWSSNLQYLDLNLLWGNGELHDKNTNTIAFQYKWDQPDEESGQLKDVLNTTWSPDGKSVLITWSAVGSIDINAFYLKAADHYLAWNLQNVDWSNYVGFYVTNNLIRNRQGIAQDISHLQLQGGPVSVPDHTGTLWLMIAGLGALLAYRRHRG